MGLIKTLIVGGSAVAVANQLSKKRNQGSSRDAGPNYYEPQYTQPRQHQYQSGPPPGYNGYQQEPRHYQYEAPPNAPGQYYNNQQEPRPYHDGPARGPPPYQNYQQQQQQQQKKQ